MSIQNDENTCSSRSFSWFHFSRFAQSAQQVTCLSTNNSHNFNRYFMWHVVSYYIRRLSFPPIHFADAAKITSNAATGNPCIFFSFVCVNGQCGFCLLFVCVFISRNWLMMIIDCRFDHGLAMVKAVDGNCGCCRRTNAEEHLLMSKCSS